MKWNAHGESILTGLASFHYSFYLNLQVWGYQGIYLVKLVPFYFHVCCRWADRSLRLSILAWCTDCAAYAKCKAFLKARWSYCGTESLDREWTWVNPESHTPDMPEVRICTIVYDSSQGKDSNWDCPSFPLTRFCFFRKKSEVNAVSKKLLIVFALPTREWQEMHLTSESRRDIERGLALAWTISTTKWSRAGTKK